MKKDFGPLNTKQYIDGNESSCGVIRSSMNRADQALNRFLHAIADPTRRKILLALKEGARPATQKGLCATDIERRLDVTQPTVSHHMSILERAGLVDVKKAGLWRWYQRNEKAIAMMMKSLRETL